MIVSEVIAASNLIFMCSCHVSLIQLRNNQANGTFCFVFYSICTKGEDVLPVKSMIYHGIFLILAIPILFHLYKAFVLYFISFGILGPLWYI